MFARLLLAEFVIADMTTANPYGFHELGVRDAQGALMSGSVREAPLTHQQLAFACNRRNRRNRPGDTQRVEQLLQDLLRSQGDNVEALARRCLPRAAMLAQQAGEPWMLKTTCGNLALIASRWQGQRDAAFVGDLVQAIDGALAAG